MTKTEQYISKAIKEAAKDFKQMTIRDVAVTMNLEPTASTELLAEALNNQSLANIANAKAIEELASKLTTTEACAIRMEG